MEGGGGDGGGWGIDVPWHGVPLTEGHSSHYKTCNGFLHEIGM